MALRLLTLIFYDSEKKKNNSFNNWWYGAYCSMGGL